MLWAALLPALPCSPSARAEALSGLATWCLQFTPRVAVLEADVAPAIVMEVEASLRLFGGRRRLIERIRDESAELGVTHRAWAPTSGAAVALARAGQSNGLSRPLPQLLDVLPIETLTSVAAHRATLIRLGCRTLGEVRSLPRGGLSRRFDGLLLQALDQAYGLRPEAHHWATLPEVFRQRVELMSRVELAPALLQGARRLLLQMTGWLAARHAGVTAFTLRWWHDVMRAKSAGDGGALTVRTAQATRDIEHLTRLLAEHLAQLELLAPVGDLELEAIEVESMAPPSLTLFPEPQAAGEGLALALERIAARLGPQRVLRPQLREDHRPEWMCHWHPAPQAPVHRPREASRSVAVPQPTFLLAQPLRLALRGHRPIYQGVLQPLLGPHRVEGGWWDRTEVNGQTITRHVSRDYWVALSDEAGLLSIFQTRLDDQAAWFLHGRFA